MIPCGQCLDFEGCLTAWNIYTLYHAFEDAGAKVQSINLVCPRVPHQALPATEKALPAPSSAVRGCNIPEKVSGQSGGGKWYWALPENGGEEQLAQH